MASIILLVLLDLTFLILSNYIFRKIFESASNIIVYLVVFFGISFSLFVGIFILILVWFDNKKSMKTEEKIAQNSQSDIISSKKRENTVEHNEFKIKTIYMVDDFTQVSTRKQKADIQDEECFYQRSSKKYLESAKKDQGKGKNEKSICYSIIKKS